MLSFDKKTKKQLMLVHMDLINHIIIIMLNKSLYCLYCVVYFDE